MATVAFNFNNPDPSHPEPSHEEGHSHNNIVKRFFIGPMPERVISNNEARPKKTNKLTLGSVFSLSLDTEGNHKVHNPDKSDEVTRIVKDNAVRFFVHDGGKAEDWAEDDEQHLVDDVVERWKNSEWGKLWSQRHQRVRRDTQNNSATAGQWFGTSFEVGNLMGVNILEEKGHVMSRSIHSRTSCKGDSTRTTPGSHLSPSVAQSSGQETYFSAPSQLTPTVTLSRIEPNDVSFLGLPHQTTSPVSSESQLAKDQATASSQNNEAHKKMQRSATFNVITQTQDITGISRSSTQMGFPLTPDRKGKARMVHYADNSVTESPVRTPGPLPVGEVLGRNKDTVDANTSLAASRTSPEPPTSDLLWGDAVMRDRMLVRVAHSGSEGFTKFDESINRTTRDLQYEDWGEFLVAWRRDSLEIYRDHITPGKEWLTGYKHLSYVIPLRGSRTKFSLYSFVDLTLCITCAPTKATLNAATSRWIFSRDKDGTNIFIFKLKCRSRAYDWAWQLWRHMGGQIPSSINIHNPRLNTRVTVDVPPEQQGGDAEGLYHTFTRKNLIDLCLESLRTVPDWNLLVERELIGDRSLQLAWRVNGHLDWVWLEQDMSGNYRDWAVLCGLAFRQSLQQPVLDVRVAQHALNHIHLKDGIRMYEPPGVEGYLERIRPNTQTKQQIYLSTHNGFLFALPTTSPFPPLPPGLAAPISTNSDPHTLRHAEIRRGANQVMAATNICDLRTIVLVRRAFQLLPTNAHTVREDQNNDAWMSTWQTSEERSPEDLLDEEGEVGLTKPGGDRVRLRMRRSFELLLNSGHIIRFEAHSCTLAIEWIERLRDLVLYWKQRHRIDAKQEIELAQSQRPRLTPQTRVCHDQHELPPEAPLDPSAHFAAMDNLYNWCVLEGCKPIVKGSRIYMRKGLRGQYKLVQLFLVAGHLVRFKVGPSSFFYPAFRKRVSLVDAYVISGYFAGQLLPQGQFKPNADRAPRRYQDGLETDDRDEEMLFMVWYRPFAQMVNADQDPTVAPVSSKSIPALSAKHKLLVFKTRSKIERDAWCWALSSEIEKIARAQKDREEKMRDAGGLMKLG